MEKCKHEVLFFMRQYLDDTGVYLKNINECYCLNCNAKINNPMGKITVLGTEFIAPGITKKNSLDEFNAYKEKYNEFKTAHFNEEEISKLMTITENQIKVKIKKRV